MRARNIKPAFFLNEELAQVSMTCRLLFIGLWTLADKQGVLEDRPLRIKASLFPYDTVDVNGELTVLARMGFIQRYQVGGVGYIFILNFRKHQSPHHTEKSSAYPLPEPLTVKEPLNNESTCVEIPLIPDSLIPDSVDNNTSARPFYERVQATVAEGMILTNFSFVDDWLAKGLTEDAIIQTIDAVMTKKKKSPDPRPPTTLKYFHNAMGVTLAAMNEPIPEMQNVSKTTRNNGRQLTKSERADAALKQWLDGAGLSSGTA